MISPKNQKTLKINLKNTLKITSIKSGPVIPKGMIYLSIIYNYITYIDKLISKLFTS